MSNLSNMLTNQGRLALIFFYIFLILFLNIISHLQISNLSFVVVAGWDASGGTLLLKTKKQLKFKARADNLKAHYCYCYFWQYTLVPSPVVLGEGWGISKALMRIIDKLSPWLNIERCLFMFFGGLAIRTKPKWMHNEWLEWLQWSDWAN